MNETKTPNLDDWRGLAREELKGRDATDLEWQTAEGITIKPLYTAEDLEAIGESRNMELDWDLKLH